VTNAHVLQATADEELGADLVIQAWDRNNELRMRQATVIEVDKLHDLALLRFRGDALPAVTLRNSNVREGQSIAFTGFPIGGALGFSTVTHRGMISSITPFVLQAPKDQQLNERAIRSLRDGSFDIYQLDATAYPGNSGGPMFDENTGEILGVINMAFVKRTKESSLSEPSGISYAVPIKYAIQLLQRRKAN
jgi:S1-C subfamily serine protease